MDFIDVKSIICLILFPQIFIRRILFYQCTYLSELNFAFTRFLFFFHPMRIAPETQIRQAISWYCAVLSVRRARHNRWVFMINRRACVPRSALNINKSQNSPPSLNLAFCGPLILEIWSSIFSISYYALFDFWQVIIKI